MEVHVSVVSRLDHDSGQCSVVRDTFDRLGDKWSLLVVAILSAGPLRFTELKNAVNGISQRMLTLTLRKLERDGLIERTVHAEVPPRVEYCLSPLGRTLIGPVSALADWAVAHDHDIANARRSFDARR
jgi:DNA-binding HxlR family transcriptional regulator